MERANETMAGIMNEEGAIRDRELFVRNLGELLSAVGGFKSNISRACRIGKKYKNFLWKFA